MAYDFSFTFSFTAFFALLRMLPNCASAEVVTANVSTMTAHSVMLLLCVIVYSILITVLFSALLLP